MEKKALLLFSHQLTDNQAKELMEDFGVKKIVNLIFDGLMENRAERKTTLIALGGEIGRAHV